MRAHGESASNPIRTKEGVIAIPFDSAGLSISRDNGKTWSETGRHRRGSEDIQPGGKGPFMAGIHGPVVELADGQTKRKLGNFQTHQAIASSALSLK